VCVQSEDSNPTAAHPFPFHLFMENSLQKSKADNKGTKNLISKSDRQTLAEKSVLKINRRVNKFNSDAMIRKQKFSVLSAQHEFCNNTPPFLA
jgi:hypothetical protein